MTKRSGMADAFGLQMRLVQGLYYIIDDDVLFALFIPLCYDLNHVVALIIGGDTYGFYTRHCCRS